jgi:hypothetical protein
MLPAASGGPGSTGQCAVSTKGGRADYSRLTAALSARAEAVVTLSWDEMDRIVGGLPRSATDHYPYWWHGDRPNTRAWRSAGYELAHVECGASVTFRRTGTAAPAAPAHVTSAAAAPPSKDAQRSVSALRRIDPRTALLVVACSGGKARGGQPASDPQAGQWPDTLRDARTQVLHTAATNDNRVLPAWQRYTGHFYQNARPAFAEAVAAGNVVIISGGYGLVRADEPIVWYEREFKLAEWPDGLLSSLLAAEAQRTGTVVAFASRTSEYARLVRRTRWHRAGVTGLLVTITGGIAGARTEVPRRLGQAFTAFWDQAHDRYPAGTIVEHLA